MKDEHQAQGNFRRAEFKFSFALGCASMERFYFAAFGNPRMSVSPTTRATTNNMVPPETAVESNGSGPAFELGSRAAKPVLVILRITDIIEQESLHVSVWGSPDGQTWDAKALFWYPQQFYRGVTPASLDLRQRPEIKFLQARWEVNRWGRGYPRPYFKFAVEIQELSGA